ncbi:hypothetical protein F5Y18DRAFT_435856 [Xylariaceae sp. FL1019]|nr:hypothetical protein F5Y18DRAFT_435856 [Xylariaceae sp. FL1019]
MSGFTAINRPTPKGSTVHATANVHHSYADISHLGPPAPRHVTTPSSQQRRPKAQRKSNTAHEKEKGWRLVPLDVTDEAKEACPGEPATENGGRCAQSGVGVYVAKDPIEFGSFKCNRCIISKKGGCSFSASNPGLVYDATIITLGRQIERVKERTGEKRKQTRDRKKLQRDQNSPGSFGTAGTSGGSG